MLPSVLLNNQLQFHQLLDIRQDTKTLHTSMNLIDVKLTSLQNLNILGPKHSYCTSNFRLL